MDVVAVSSILISVILPFMSLSSCVGEICFNHKALEEHGHLLLTKIIPCGYMKDILPPPTDGQPLRISFNVIIQDINSFNAAHMDFRVDMFLYMTWTDRRLNLTKVSDELETEYIILPSYAIDFIWTPDPYIKNAKEAGISTLTNEFASLALFPNNTLRYSARFYSVIGCQMDFHQYPRDIQNCSVVFQSFKYSLDRVSFMWRAWNPVELNEDLELLQFYLVKPLVIYAADAKSPSSRAFGKKTRALIISLEFHREVGHHLVQTFVPSFLLVALSWFSFWMGLDAIPGRVTLLVTSMLTLTTIFIGIQDHLPPVAYIKAIDVWMAGCTVFIFSALGEFVVVKRLKETQKENKVHPHLIKKLNGMGTSPFGNLKTINVFPVHHQTGTGANQAHSFSQAPPNKPPHARFMSSSNSPRTNVVQVFDPERGIPEAQGLNRGGSHGLHNHPSMKAEELMRTRAIPLQWFDYKTGKEKILHEEIDRVSRVVFPLVFLLFMLIYFPVLLTRSF